MITDLYSRLKKLKVVVRLVDGRIDLQAPKGVLNKELLQEIKDNKEALIVLLDTYKKRTINYLSIEKVPEQQDYKLSSSQYRLWILSQFEGGNAAYNMPGVYEIKGSLDPVLLERAFNEIISRHEILRTVFREHGDGEVRQVILGAADQVLRISITDLCAGSSAELCTGSPAELGSLLDAAVSDGFDLASGPLLRAGLYRLGNDHWVLSFVMHHIISDGWSLGVLMRELAIFYNAGVRGKVASLAALPLQYKDYSGWEQSQLSGELLITHRNYWLNQFSGDLPVLELPADRLRPEIRSYRGGSVHHQLDKTLVEELKKQSHAAGGTLFMGLIAGVTGLLYRYSHQQDIVIGSPIAGRHHGSLEDQIGLYLNTLALRMRFGDEDSFRSLLDKSCEVALGAYEHQVYPFDELINSLPVAENGLFNVMVVLQNNALVTRSEEAILDGLEIQNYQGLENKVSKFDLLFEFAESQAGIHLGIAYNSDIYDEVRISRMAVHLEQFLVSALARPEVSLGALKYLSAAEEYELLETFNPKAAAYAPGTVLDLLKARHDIDPDAIALVYEDRQVSYRWLDEQSALLSVYLREECQLAGGELVGVQLQRTEWLIVSLLGVLKSGCAYVPVDSGYPQQRIDYLLADSGCKVVVDESFLAAFQQEMQDLSAEVSAERLAAAGLQAAVYAAELSTASLAYLIYTSGSTGLPKGVMVSHGNMYSFLKWSEKEFGSSDFEVVFGVTSVCFDLSVYEIFYPLISGKLLRLLPDGLSIGSYLPGSSKVLLNTVPSVVGGLLREGTDLSGVSVLNMAGEPVPGSYLEQLDLSVMEVRNLYGPSEDTTYSTCYRFETALPVLIGKPIDHTQVYILDSGCSLVPVGVSGEICLGGLGVSLGYLNREELTAERFVTNPFKPGERMYCTGDLGRWDSRGFIEYQGRLDEQVKIRGYRVELGEIESRLVSLEGIGSAVVLARSAGHDGDQELVAYLVGEGEISASAIREQLGSSIPGYLVPNYYVQVASIPLTSNGKVDKKKLLALAVTGLSSGVSYIAPRNAVEQELAVIWSALLGSAQIGVKDNFFDLGGHSLKAMTLLSRIAAVFSVSLSIKDIFTHRCLEDQARLIGMSSASVLSPIPLVAEAADYVLSSSLKRLWLLSQFEGGNAAYNMPGVYEIKGSLDPVLLERAFNEIISRHEILRTVFREHGDGEVRQVILGAADQVLRISMTDLCVSSSAELCTGSPAELGSLLDAAVSGGFDLASGPLLRAGLYRLGINHWVLSFVMHHIISDGWSLGVLMRELAIFYNAGVRGEVAALAALPLQYKDYSDWEQSQLSGELLIAHRNYWLDQFSGDLPVLELPADRLRPEIRSYRGGSVHHQLDKRLVEELKKQSTAGGGTLFMGLIAGVTGLLYRYSHQQDIVIGSPIAGRHHESLEDQIGLYLNTLALRMRFGDEDSFRSLLDKSCEVALGAYEHQVYPFDEVMNELPLQGNNLFNVMVVLQNNAFNTGMELDTLDGVTMSSYQGLENRVSKFDLLFEFVETSAGIRLEITYNSDIYDEIRIFRMAVHLEQFLVSALARPEVSLGALKYLSAAEEYELLETFNPKAAAYAPGTVLDLLKARHDIDPDAIALVYEDRQVSYRWLDEQSALLSVYLREECQLAGGELVGVQLPRTEWLIVSLLGVLKSGCAYVPVDPGYPQQRIDYLLADSGCKVVVDESFLAVFQQGIQDFPAETLADKFAAAGLQAAVYAAELSTASLAYLIYTSGSTGLPKGVMVSHGNMYSFLKWSEKEFGSSDFEVVFGVTSVCFDLSVYEIFYPLISGKLLRLLPDGLSISSYLPGSSKVLLNTVPSVVGGLLREGTDLSGVSVLNMAGEPVPGSYLEALDLSVMEVRNLYGPSEDTTYSTCYRFEKALPVLIGKPIDHTQVYILDSGCSLVPVGVSGEICLGGLGVSLGYLNREELTAEKFVTNPFKPGERMYCTGDLGRWDSRGFIEYQGRLDEQVKIRGYRVELGEIESRLVSLEGIGSAVVLARSAGQDGDQELVAYLVGEGEISASAIREQLGRSMPGYLVPNYYVQVASIPLTSNGKVDKKKLLALAVTGLSSGVSYIAPRNAVEQELAVIWSALLGSAQIGVKDNFFDLGGHSLKAMTLQNILNKRYGFGLKIQDIYNYPTIEALALNKEKNTSFLNLNKGTADIKRSVYFIPPILGSSIIYRTLAESLEGEFNCYGLQYPGLEKGEVLFSSIEQAARDFSKKIMAHSTAEELIIVGYSMGAAIAFEIAKILEAQGKSLRLILVDRNPRQNANSIFDFGYKKRAIDYLFEQFKQIVQAVNLEEKDLKKFLTNNIGILDKYEYQGVIKSPMHVVEALGNEVRTNMKDWEKHTEGNFNISFINEEHWQLFSENTVPQFLKIVQLN